MRLIVPEKLYNQQQRDVKARYREGKQSPSSLPYDVFGALKMTGGTELLVTDDQPPTPAPAPSHLISSPRRGAQIHHTAGLTVAIPLKNLSHTHNSLLLLFEMVSTRGHPKEFPEPDLTPSRSTTSRARKGKWAHTPSNLAIIWLFISLPLVTWDAGYVMFRPHTMPGGKLHWPLYVPYDLYGRIDYIYGWKAFNERNGFTAAQTILNLIETAMYTFYMYILFAHGKQSSKHGRGAPRPALAGFLGQQRAVEGKMGALAVLVGYSAAVMTVSKTFLYCAFNSFRIISCANAIQGSMSTILVSITLAITAPRTSFSSGSFLTAHGLFFPRT